VVRVTSALWVSAFIRRCYADGAAAVVSRRGAEEAGAIFVVVDRLDGTADLYGPAPQSVAADDAADRLFERVLERALPDALRSNLDREQKFDPDVWIVEVEDRAGRVFLDLAGSRPR
jgi:hypothetical protein